MVPTGLLAEKEVLTALIARPSIPARLSPTSSNFEDTRDLSVSIPSARATYGLRPAKTAEAIQRMDPALAARSYTLCSPHS